MLPVKRGILSLPRASSSRSVLTTRVTSSRRFYVEDNNNNNNSRKNVYVNILSASNEHVAKLDTESNPFAQRVDGADRDAINDILSPPRKPAPDLPPRMSPLVDTKLTRRVKAAPLVDGMPDSRLAFPQRRERKESDYAEDELDGLPPLSASDGNGSDFASERAKMAFGSGGVSITPTRVDYRLYVNARPKNCIMTLVDERAQMRASISAGRCGFRNAMEGSYEAGYQCAVRMFEMVRTEMERRREEMRLEIFLNGFGQGRSALLKALTMSEGDGVRESVVRLTDKTPIKIGGVRLQKKRRL